ncbi:hypothetical protein V6N11_001255 [Hibiscus sabdariffa]|uniref:Uncharacterized protein n=1 Tax=Hibiscus sabdariffa TaxID=183260 RepID=A0ABR2S006_9ROSI
MPSSAVAGGYTNFAQLMGYVGVPATPISPQASTPSAPVSTSFSPQATAAFVPNSSKSVSVIPAETTWVVITIPLVTRNTVDMDNLVSYDMFSVPNTQMSSQQRTGLVEAVNSTENDRCLCNKDGFARVNASKLNRTLAKCVRSDAELAGGSLVCEASLPSGSREQGADLDVLLELEDALLPTETCELSDQVDQGVSHEQGVGLNSDCHEQRADLDVLLESEDAILPTETCEFSDQVNQGVQSEESLRLEGDNDVVSAANKTVNSHPMVTRAKSGIRKSKVYQAEVSNVCEPKTIGEAFKDENWKAAA